MIDFTNAAEVRALQNNVRVALNSPQGKEIIKFLEGYCGWYDFYDTKEENILVKNGRRQVLATLKTLLEHSPEQITHLAIESEE